MLVILGVGVGHGTFGKGGKWRVLNSLKVVGLLADSTGTVHGGSGAGIGLALAGAGSELGVSTNLALASSALSHN